eukprot:TRINITY_DN9128_c0_g2_i1.p1 TRINITY_DN9128_c0_g2~~TRINITY_DN9128_c0_g2_i1.p1  ORF type:complete len:762 (+),score=253.37 TRINITY_DN9128_c0_g2_i1:81-2366(+)
MSRVIYAIVVFSIAAAANKQHHRDGQPREVQEPKSSLEHALQRSEGPVEIPQEFEFPNQHVVAAEGSSSILAVSSLWKASFALRTTVVVLSAIAVIGLAMSGMWFWKQTPSNTQKGVDEEEKGLEIDAEEGKPLAAEAVVEQAKEKASPDYEEKVREMMQQVQDKYGSKFQAGGEVATMLQDKAEGFADKAKALVMNELNDTAGSIAKALEMDDFMALLDWDAAIAANFPPLSILLAGLLVPVNLGISFACHLSQVVLVLLPLLVVTLWSEYADWDHPCKSIPGLRLWARVVMATALAVAVARLVMIARIKSAMSALQAKSEEMKAQLAKAESAGDNVSVGDLKELFIAHSNTLQFAVVCESRCNTSVFSHIVGFGTLIWLLSTFYNTYLYFAYMFVPGVVAFHPSAADDPSYCAAWVTVCASKVAIVVAVLFFFMNVATVFFWLTETAITSEAFTTKLSSQARAFDSSNMGIPAAQLLVRAFVVRAKADVLVAKFAVSVREKSALAREYEETESRLLALKAQVAKKDAEVSKMEEHMEKQGGGTIEAQVERMSEKGLDFTSMQAKASLLIDEAKAQAASTGIAATDEIEKLVEYLNELMTQVTNSDSFKAAQAKAEEAKKVAEDAAQQAAAAAERAATEAAKQAQDLAQQAQASASDAMEKLQDPALMEQAQAMAAQAKEQGQAMATKATASASDAMEKLQDPALMEQAQAMAAQATEQGQVMAKKAADTMEKAQAVAAQAKKQGQAVATKGRKAKKGSK